MHLRHGVTVEQAVTALNEAIMETVHVPSSAVQAEQKRQAYLNWADATLQAATALDLLACLEARQEVLRHQLLHAARHLAGARALTARLYGAGPVTALTLTCRLGGKDRFSSARQAVWFAGLDITVWSSDRKGPPRGLSRQGPPALRWAVYEADKAHARAPAPDHTYYAQVKDRKNGKRAARPQAGAGLTQVTERSPARMGGRGAARRMYGGCAVAAGGGFPPSEKFPRPHQWHTGTSR